jgi:rare lipoprotein A
MKETRKKSMDMNIVKQRNLNFILIALCAFGCAFAPGTKAHAGVLPDIDPEIVSNVWEEETQTCAAVTLNGKDLITYKGECNGHTAEQRAEELAAKLKELIDDNKLDANKLMPSHDGDTASVTVDGSPVLKFEVSKSESTKSAIEQCYAVVNQIRQALGASSLPQTYLKIAELAGQDPGTMKSRGNWFHGHASWYGGKFHGRKAADGSRYDQDGLTAAHKSLPFGTKLLVMNRSTGKSCVVQVTDRGPFVKDRVIDLSRGAARQLNLVSSGVAMVDCLVLPKE